LYFSERFFQFGYWNDPVSVLIAFLIQFLHNLQFFISDKSFLLSLENE
jgi:hypothetical protein